MATARDKLVADWRHELHAAQDAIAVSPQHAWLARMKLRLYRFLLSCYGKSPWTTTPPPRDEFASVVFDQPEAQFLHGKPAKTAGKIQAVLKSVAGAQSSPKPGSIAVGAGEHSYLFLAAESKTCDTLRLFAALKREGLAVRHVVRDGQDVVEIATTEFPSGSLADAVLRRPGRDSLPAASPVDQSRLSWILRRGARHGSVHRLVRFDDGNRRAGQERCSHRARLPRRIHCVVRGDGGVSDRSSHRPGTKRSTEISRC